MTRISATPSPDALTQRQAKALGLVEFLSMAICRRGPCDTFHRVTRTLQCVACRDREAPKLAALAEAAAAKAKVARLKAAAQAQKDAANVASGASATAARARAREVVKRAATTEKARATRAADKAAFAEAQEGVQEGLQQPAADGRRLPPWMAADDLAGDEVAGAHDTQEAGTWDVEDQEAEGPPW